MERPSTVSPARSWIRPNEGPLLLRRVIVGTAGHIDHGKTTLIHALTGIDCDRWQEEKRRGITIDLGFAHLVEGDLQVGFIDVPGHERFVHNALAGLGGIRVVLLVVAADEGVKPQTREHLAICSLLSIPSCVVALAKSDLVDREVIELARLEIEELIGATRFAGSPIVPISSTTGVGMDALRQTLLAEAAAQAIDVDSSAPPRYPIDRSFHLKGLGVVTTGTLAAGRLSPGMTLLALPSGDTVRIRSLQVHGETRERAVAGERTALQLTGVDLTDLYRGLQLVEENRFQTSLRIAARYSLLPDAPKSLKGWTSVRFHLLSGEVGAKIRPLLDPIEPGTEGFVEIRLAEPLVAIRGDQFVVRRPSPAMTLGGGVVLDPAWRRPKQSALRSALESLAGDRMEVLQHWVSQAREQGLDIESLARRLGVVPEAIQQDLDSLTSEQRLLSMPAGRGHPKIWVAPRVYRRVTERAQSVMSAYFRRQRLSQGMPKAEAVDRILPSGARHLADGYLEWLCAQKSLEVRGDRVDLPGRAAEMTGEESKLSQEIVAGFAAAGLKPPSPKELCREIEAKPQIFEGVVDYLLDKGDLIRLPGGLLIASSAIETVVGELLSSGHQEFDVGEFKTRFALTRKWAIPILEHLDSSGVTRRVGDKRQIVGPRA